jgi:putative FmdB family regulatory protein
MPLYEYECFLCQQRFERIQRVSDDPVKECPECGGAVRRLLGVPALQFKGSGFYITDYGKGNGNGASPDRKEVEKAAESSASTDSTPTPPKKETTKDSSAKTEAKASSTNSEF